MPRRRTHPVLTLTLAAGGVALLVAEGCQDASQVTLEILLRQDLPCSDVASGTTITVGADAAAVEARVASGDITTKTATCDSSAQRIGTLVVTPGESGRGAVVVVVGYRGTSPDTCKPPKYDGCIVARRRFTFADHTSLRMPITIDPACASVDCGLDQTCRDGACFTSEIAIDACAGGVCDQPGGRTGETPDEAGTLPPAPPPDSGIKVGEGPPVGTPLPWCSPVNALWCNDDANAAAQCPICCERGPARGRCAVSTNECTSAQSYCCQGSDCANGVCVLPVDGPSGAPGRCSEGGVTCGSPPDSEIRCPVPCGAGEACCGTAPGSAACASIDKCGSFRFCCSDADCDGVPGSCVDQNSGGFIFRACVAAGVE